MGVVRQLVWWYTWYVLLVLTFGGLVGLGVWLVGRVKRWTRARSVHR